MCCSPASLRTRRPTRFDWLGAPLKDIRLPSDEVLPWHAHVRDRWVRWRERIHQERSEGIPSAEAIDEASAYYQGLYVNKAPDPLAFSRLLRRRGAPDWVNPYDMTQEDFHLIHPDGFLWADVQFLVEALLRKAQSPQEELAGEEASRLHNAQICWMLLLQETGGAWPSSLREIHPDNLSAVTLEALFNPHLALWGIQPEAWPRREFIG